MLVVFLLLLNAGILAISFSESLRLYMSAPSAAAIRGGHSRTDHYAQNLLLVVAGKCLIPCPSGYAIENDALADPAPTTACNPAPSAILPMRVYA